jgi:hypothetical protein
MSQYAIDVSVADFDEKVLAASRRVPRDRRFLGPLVPALPHPQADPREAGRRICRQVHPCQSQFRRKPGAGAALWRARHPRGEGFHRAASWSTNSPARCPESQIREFLDHLIPSPAEPLRQEALALAAPGRSPRRTSKIGRGDRSRPERTKPRISISHSSAWISARRKRSTKRRGYWKPLPIAYGIRTARQR